MIMGTLINKISNEKQQQDNHSTLSNRESLAQFQNQIKPRVYIRLITRSTMFEKKLHFSRNCIRKISSVACGYKPITCETDFSDYLKSLISRQN